MELKKTLGWLAAAAGAGAGAAIAYKLVTDRYRLSLTEATVAIRNLPPELDGMKVAHLTDFHAGETTPLWFIRQAVEYTNALQPDLVVMTGDYIDDEEAPLQEPASVLGELAAPLGVYGVLGNHDYWLGAERVARTLQDAGITILRNESVAVGEGEARLWVVGLDETAGHREDFRLALEGVPEEEPKLVLSHSPDVLPRAADLRMDLVLAGHTHGGQVYIPGFGAPYAPVRVSPKYVSGSMRYCNTRMHVSRGIGMTMLPIRFCSLPEIGLFELTRPVREVGG